MTIPPANLRHCILAKPLAASLAAGCGAFLLYVLTFAGEHTYDALMFASAIDAGVFLPSVFRPHNLFFLPSAIAIRRALGALGFGVSPIALGQAWAALWGAAAVAIFHKLASRFLAGWRAWALTALFATTNALWSMSTEVEVYTTSLAAILAVYWALARRKPRVLLAGVFWGFAIVAHLTNVLLGAAILARFLVFPLARPGGQKARNSAILIRLRGALFCGLLAAAVAGAAYCAAGFGAAKVHSPAGLIRWIESYAMRQKVYGMASLGQLALGAKGFQDAIATETSAAGLACLHAALLLWSAALLWRIRSAGRHLRFMRACAIALGVHAIVYATFFIWWEPLNIEFWVATLLPMILLIGLGWRAALRSGREFEFGALLAAALAVQVGFNGARMIERRDPARDVRMQQARVIGAAIRPVDLVVTFNDPLLFTLPLAAGHRQVVAVDVMAGSEDVDFARAMRDLNALANVVRGYGGRVYVTSEGWNPNPAFFERLGVSLDEYRRALREAARSPLEESFAEGLLLR